MESTDIETQNMDAKRVIPDDTSVRKGSISLEKTDDALAVIQEMERYEYSALEERRVVRKIDLWLMPVMAASFGMYALDKGSIGYTALWDLKSDTHLVGAQYSLLTTLFFVGFLIAEYPLGFIAQKLPIAKLLAAIVFIWGSVLILMAACHDFGGLAALRFLMGMCESGVQPLFVMLISMFYTRDEQPVRTCVFFGFNGLSPLLGGPMSYGIGKLNTTFPRWKIFFLTLGAWTLLWSIVVFLVLPDSPLTARWKDNKEKFIAIERLRGNRTGVKNTVIKSYQILEAFKDPAMWLLVIWVGASVQLNISGSFQALIIQGLGFDAFETSLFNMPAGAIQIVGTLLVSFLNFRFPNKRWIIITICLLITIAGAAMLLGLSQSQRWARLVGVWLITGIAIAFPVMLSYLASNFAGYTKKVTVSATIFVFWSVGNIVAPQLFLNSEAPYYGTGLRNMLVSACIVQVVTILLPVLYYYRNKRRDTECLATPDRVIDNVDNTEFLDRTDFEDRRFRYVY